MIPTAFFGVLVGLFILVSRKIALNQVVGYLVLENGIYTFGLVLMPHQTLMVELGILLDLFVGVFVMGIAIFQINREFDHINADRMTGLRDWSDE
jgi:hydrogenase-4 component E